MRKRSFLSLNDALKVVPSGDDCHALRQFNFRTHEQPASVARLLDTMGFGLRFEDMPNAISASLEHDSWSPKGYEIVINKRHPVTRQRFSALHEVGHYFLHPHQISNPFAEPNRALGSSFDRIYSAQEELEESETNQWSDAVAFGNSALEAALAMFGRDYPLLRRHFGFSDEVLSRAIRRHQL